MSLSAGRPAPLYNKYVVFPAPPSFPPFFLLPLSRCFPAFSAFSFLFPAFPFEKSPRFPLPSRFSPLPLHPLWLDKAFVL